SRVRERRSWRSSSTSLGTAMRKGSVCMAGLYVGRGAGDNPSLPDVFRGDAELAHLLLEVLPVHPHLLGRLGDVAAVTPEGVQDEAALECPHRRLLGLAKGARAVGRGPRRRGRGCGGRRLTEEIGRGDLRPGRQEERLLHGGTELAHVPLPGMAAGG